MTGSFYKGKRVFITGHTGFKGSWLTIWLKKLGASVTGYALQPPTNTSMYDICRLNGIINSNVKDIRDSEALTNALMSSEPEIIFHLAAQPLVRLSYEKPVETYETNVMGTANLLDAIRNCSSVRAVVVVTSDKCYENKESYWGYRETDRLGGYDPYSNSKACQELVTSAFINSYFNPGLYDSHGVAIATARAGNVIGGGDFAQDRLVPDIIRSIMNNEKLSIRNPQAIRPWQHVMEPLYGYMTLAEKLYQEGPAYSGAWNFGPHDNSIKTVEWIVNKMLNLFCKSSYYSQDGNNSLHETTCLLLDSHKALRLLDYSPRFSIDKAVELTVLWTKAYLEGADMYKVTEQQIEEYDKV